jgi:putative Holliday junction resolvase
MVMFNRLPDFRATLPPGLRLLGLDPGTRRLGLALSDVNRRIATPYAIIPRTKIAPIAAEIATITAREGVGGLVIGWPVSEDGRRAQSTRDWAFALSAATALPTLLWDESFSTADAHEHMIEAGLSRTKRAAIIDQVAAAAILQAALDALHRA